MATVYLDKGIPTIKISYSQNLPLDQQLKFTQSMHAAELLFASWDKGTIELYEEFKVIFLNNGHVVKGIFNASAGGFAGTVVDIRMIFGAALQSCVPLLILAHNHPSGTLKPSEADREITKKIVEAGRLLDIKVIDHIILSPTGDHYSFADSGIL